MAHDEEQFLGLVTQLVVLEQSRNFAPLTLDLGPYSAFVLVGALQLAWRHPDHAPKLKDIIEQIARRVQDGFPPEYAELLEAGWDPSRDVEVTR